jgi:hypothetical protein
MLVLPGAKIVRTNNNPGGQEWHRPSGFLFFGLVCWVEGSLRNSVEDLEPASNCHTRQTKPGQMVWFRLVSFGLVWFGLVWRQTQKNRDQDFTSPRECLLTRV